MRLDPDQCWQAVAAQDARFDGWIYCGVTSTGIYCRPSCPARTPKRENVRFFSTAAAAQAAGLRACKRCRPDATPGSPEWTGARTSWAARMRLIADGLVDREGVAGLAARLGYSERHLNRQLVDVVGVGPLAIARARRAHTARVVLELTDLPITRVAFASGFSSVRQFNATVQEVFATTPRALRGKGPSGGGDTIALRLPFRAPLAASELLAFLGLRAVKGVEELDGETYRRSLDLPHGAGVVSLTPHDDHVEARFWLDDVRDLATAAQRCRQLLDLDSDPQAVVDALQGDPTIGALVRRHPGRRVPGHVDGAELAMRAVIGQQVSVAGARTVAGTLTQRFGARLDRPVGGITHLFPSASALRGLTPDQAPMPASRARTIAGLAAALDDGEVTLDAGADPHATREALLVLPGIGPWTADCIAMRTLRDPDAFLPTDLGVRRALEALGHDGDPKAIEHRAEAWRPYRAYANLHLWASETAPPARAAA